MPVKRLADDFRLICWSFNRQPPTRRSLPVDTDRKFSAEVPVQHGVTTTASVMAQGYHPYLADWSPYHATAYAVIEATARLVATGLTGPRLAFLIRNIFSEWTSRSVSVSQ